MLMRIRKALATALVGKESPHIVLRWIPPQTTDNLEEEPHSIPAFWNLDRYLAHHIADRMDEYLKFSMTNEVDCELERSIASRLHAYATMPYTPINGNVEAWNNAHIEAQNALTDLAAIFPSLWC